jgi:dnd system-associated protein 4
MPVGMPAFPGYIRMDRKQYNDLLEPIVKEKRSPFYKFDRTGVYIMAAALGFKSKAAKKIQNPIDVRLFAQLGKEYMWAIFTIAVAESGKIDVLLDGKKALQIVEEYANGGVQILYDKIFKSNLDYSLENEMIKVLEKVKL